jgi:hypothetical protein
MPKRLTDDEIARIRALDGQGWSRQAIADEIGITPQYAGRVLAGSARAELPPVGPGPVAESVDSFLAMLDLEPPTGSGLKLVACSR